MAEATQSGGCFIGRGWRSVAWRRGRIREASSSLLQKFVYTLGGNVWVAGGVGCVGEMGYPARAISPAGPRFIAWVGGNAERVVSESGGPRHVRRG